MLYRTRTLLTLAALCLAALTVTGVLAKLVPVAQQSDARTLTGFELLNRPRLTPVLDAVAHLADPAPYALAGLALTLLALVRGRWPVAAAIPVVLTLTGLTTELLKHLVASPRMDEWLGRSDMAAASWPSGHATAAMSLALCAVLASPQRLRPTVAALGGAFAVAIAYSILTLGWHFPSDVLGGFFVAGLYGLLAAAALTAADRRWPHRRTVERGPRAGELVPALAVAMIAAGVAVGLALARPRTLVGYATEHTTFVVGAGVIAALALSLAVVLAANLRAVRR